jgi:hypothetical protein
MGSTVRQLVVGALFGFGLAAAHFAVLVWAIPPNYSLKSVVGVPVFCVMWFIAAYSCGCCVRAWNVYRCWRDPGRLQAFKSDLSSDRPWRRLRALQLIADVTGHPFGYVSCWPGLHLTERQVAQATALYLQWAELVLDGSVRDAVLDQDVSVVFHGTAEGEAPSARDPS